MGSIILFLILSKPIKFEADSLYYDAKNKVLYLFKDVKIEYENITLFADTLLYYHEKNLMYAFSNARLKSGKDSLRGKKIIYNLKTQKGKVIKGRTKIDRGFLWAEEIFRVDKNILKAFEGHYTTCDLEEPHYFFLSKKVKVIPKKDIIAQPVFLFIKDFPVLALPFWIFPATRNRKSGFLAPRPGRNSNLGLYIKNLSYYWAINPYMDLTVGFDLYERKGLTGFFNFVYKRFKIFEGNISSTFTREINPKRERWNINGIHSHNLPFQTRMQAKIDFISDQRYATDYSEYRPERLKSEAYSYLTISKNFKFASFTLLSDYRDNFLNKTKEYTIPKISVNFYGKNFGAFRASGGLNYLRKIKKDTLSKTDNRNLSLSENINFQQNILGFLNVYSAISASQTIYPEDTLGNKFPVVHSLNLRATSSITFYGKTIFKPFYFDRLYHFATLTIGYSYTPGFKALNLKSSYPRKPSSKMTFSLKNDYFSKREKSKISLLNVVISGDYDFLKEEQKLSNINIALNFPLPRGFSGNGNSIYNPYSGKIEQTNLRISFNLQILFTDFILPSEKKLNLNGSYTYSKALTKETHNFSGGINGSITKNWSFSYNLIYSSEEKRITSQSLNLTRNLHCFSLQIRWSKTLNYWDYQFRIWITQLPDLKIERNFFETILPSLQE